MKNNDRNLVLCPRCEKYLMFKRDRLEGYPCNECLAELEEEFYKDYQER